MKRKSCFTILLLTSSILAFSQNTNLGANAGNAGYNNTSIGFGAGDLVTGSSNIFLGHNSGVRTSSGNQNSILGAFAGYNNKTGLRNTFLGYRAGYGNTTGNDNTIVGVDAGVSNTISWGNTLIGRWCGNTTTGAYNTFLGTETGKNTTTGEYNLYAGVQAGRQNSTGSRNTILGMQAGFSSTGSNNVFLGYQAGSNETGSNKLVINATGGMPLVYGDFATKQLGVGTTTLGTYTLSVNGDAFATGLWLSSDRRFKQNERRIEGALEKINQVNGIKYQFKNSQTTRERNFSKGDQLGLIAQDLKKVFPELVKEDGDGYLAVNYQGVIPVLIEAIKDLSGEVEQLKTRLSEVKSSNGSEQRNSITRKGGALGQNHPNPANQTTQIEYNLPDEVTRASLYVFDLNGRQVSVYDNLQAGSGTVTIQASQLPAGLYHYSLVADGTIIDTKKMLLTSN